MRRTVGLPIAAAVLALAAVSCTSSDPAVDPASAPAGPVETAGSRPESASLPVPPPPPPLPAGPVVSLRDPRLEPLLRAAEGWRQAQGPPRRVLDQVVLVPDEASFFEAVAAWDEHQFFPILIDDPAWSLLFLRAFRPARVVRFRPLPSATATAPDEPLRRWAGALGAVARAWTREDAPETPRPTAARVPRHLGATPPGLVLSEPRSPTLAAAVALAAGRFQPLVEFHPSGPSAFRTFADVLSLAEARDLARQVERRAADVAGPGRGLGDGCDFLTLAGDWPYRYRNDVESGQLRGDAALDDLIGRPLDWGEGGLAATRGRWAFTGRILGDPAASVYRAMCALFLRPEETLLWNTYSGGTPWSTYRMTGAARLLEGLLPGAPPPLIQEGAAASLSAWHEATTSASRFGCVFLNSSGEPRRFSIPGGPGRPSDLPRGSPVAAIVIHSFSAADPRDAWTLAGRWLENGAYAYFGSMNEPFLTAFRTPEAVLGLSASGVPLSAALRQGDSEPFGRPWRLVYLGDPLYRLPIMPGEWRRQPADTRQSPGAEPCRPLTTARGRLDGEILAAGDRPPSPSGDPPARLDACLSLAIRSFCRGGGGPAPGTELLAIDRRSLEPPQREILDALVLDTLRTAADQPRLLAYLLAIPPAEISPRVGRALETTLMSGLMRLAADGTPAAALGLWDAMIFRPWPPGSDFPAHLTERLAGLVASAGPGLKDEYIAHLRRALASLAGRPEAAPRRDLVASELSRLGLRATPSGR